MVRTPAENLEALHEARSRAEHAGTDEQIKKQHDRGKLTARERINLLVDPDSFTEIDRYRIHRTDDFGLGDQRIPGDGVIAGHGTIDGRPVCVYAQDFTVFGGSLGEVHADKIQKIQKLAMKMGVPIIGLNDSGGARIQEGVGALAGYGVIFRDNVRASGVIPQITAIMGPCAGGAVYSPAMTDFILMVRETSHMFITGPSVIETVTGEQVTMEELGGADTHSTKTGVAHFAADSDEDCIEDIKYLLGFLPQNNLETPPTIATADDPDRLDNQLNTFMPDSPNIPYDVRDIIRTVVDEHEFCEIQEHFATNVVIGFGRLDGHTVGVVGNQPMAMAGCLDTHASEKAARFIRTCDAFNIPIVSFVDVPGFLPGTEQEWDGIINRGAKLLYAYCEATVPKLTVITRKAYGGAYIVMGSKHVGGDVNLAWPTAEIAVMGAKGAVNVLHRRAIASAEDPEATANTFIEAYEERFNTPWQAAQMGYIDDVIEPAETRQALIRGLRLTHTKREYSPARKHGNIPL
ncbi:acyl-CoA carboxylase subunit beta [Stomatohabitans albus]|uniref:acyl-CoA carboxylase subunit beta n=1 Tax=Stomatohabitans albus TaxID=3110766 RepID=UPI00300C67A1